MNEPGSRERARFPVTRWSSLDAARSEDEDKRLEVLAQFLQAYYQAMESYIEAQFHFEKQKAKEYLHNFILNKLIRKNLLAQADRARGRFRTFLVQSLNRFIIDELRKGAASKRAPGENAASIESLSEGSLDHLQESAQERFDREFARGVVQQTIIRMRERCEATDRKDLWRVFHDRVLGAAFDDKKALPYDQLAPLLGVATETQAANLLTSAKRMFTRVFKSVVKDYEADPEAVEDEIRALRHILCNT